MMTTREYRNGFDANVTPAVHQSLADHFYGLLALSSADLDVAMTDFIRTEHELPEPIRYEATLARLRAWLALDKEDARVLAASFERATDALPREFRENRIAAERAVMTNALYFEQFRRLSHILPWLRAERAPRGVPEAA